MAYCILSSMVECATLFHPTCLYIQPMSYIKITLLIIATLCSNVNCNTKVCYIDARYSAHIIIKFYLMSFIMQLHTAKQEALNVIKRLPDNADMEEIMYRLYVLENIRHGQQDADQGKTQPVEEVLKEIQTW